MLIKVIVTVTGIAIAAASSSASAQVGGDAVLFSRALFKGASMTVSGPTRSMGGFVVKSIQIPPNSAWELCTGNTFTGCKRFSQTKSSMVMTVRSARPVAPPIPANATLSARPLAGSDASLRGLASEFFVMPQDNGNRIEVAANGGILERATEFCRAHGWHVSAYAREQSIQGRRYLADVLCTDETR